MNLRQKAVLLVAVATVGAMLLLPPFQVYGPKVTFFAGWHFLLSPPTSSARIASSALVMEILIVLPLTGIALGWARGTLDRRVR